MSLYRFLTPPFPASPFVLPCAWFIVGLHSAVSATTRPTLGHAARMVEISSGRYRRGHENQQCLVPVRGWDSEGLLRLRARFEFVSYSKMNGDKIWVADSKPSPECRIPLSAMGDRCFSPNPTPVRHSLPSDWSGFPVPRPSRVGIQVSVSESSIVLHSPDGQQQVGTLRGARIEKMAYVLSPSAFCGPISGWQCGVVWSLFARVEERGYEGFSSRDTSAILMKALVALRDGPSQQMR